jgi:hypothetical protein
MRAFRFKCLQGSAVGCDSSRINLAVRRPERSTMELDEKEKWELDEKEKRGFLRDEYLLLQSQYEDFDRRSLTIKGWAATGAIAGLALGFNGSTKFPSVVPIYVAIIAIVFWSIEASWKVFQYALNDRIRIIEAYFRGEQEILLKFKDPMPFQIYHSWFKAFNKDRPIYKYEETKRPRSKMIRFARAARHPSVCLLYLVIVSLSLYSFYVLHR